MDCQRCHRVLDNHCINQTFKLSVSVKSKGEVMTHPLISLYHGETSMSKLLILPLLFLGIVVAVILVKLVKSIIKDFKDDDCKEK